MNETKMMPASDISKDIERAMDLDCRDDVLNDKRKRFADDARCPSQSSSLSSNSGDICRICHCEGGLDSPLITPCYCSGSLRYVHQACLQLWIKSSDIRNCELCKFQFIMETKVKPFNEWEYLELSGLERKKLLCAMLFHIIAMTCVCWSLYVLIDRTLDEVQKGHLEWPFWTKLIVVGIGFMGGIVFMYIQCKAYFILCKRWKAYNRVIYVQNAPENTSPRVNRASAGEPSCSSKKFDPLKPNSNNIPETSCIDIKGVRNLHIFFGEENKIRLHRNDRLPEKKALTQGERAKDNETAANGKNADKTNHMCGNTSLHIQIGNMDYNDCNRVNSKSCNSAFNKYSENSAYGSALCPADLKANRTPECDSSGRYKNEFKNDQSVVKLQIKKAEIVIEFGENSDADKYANKTTANPNSDNVPKSFETCDAYRPMEIVKSPRRKFNSEEYLDCEKVANEYNELPTSGLLICKDKVPSNNCKEKFLKDWRSSEDLVRDNKTSNVRF